MTLATVGGSAVYAEENINNQLQAAIAQAEKAQKKVQENPATAYLGLDKYLEKKIAQANEMYNNGTGDAEIMTKVLNEASEATYLLLGANSVEVKTVEEAAPAEISTRSRSGTSSRASMPAAELAETDEMAVKGETVTVATEEDEKVAQAAVPVATLANTTISVTVGEKQQDDTEVDETAEKTVEEQIEDEIVEDVLDAEDIKDVEVPNTGEKKVGVVGLAIAGTVVVLLTAGAAVAIVRGKRNA